MQDEHPPGAAPTHSARPLGWRPVAAVAGIIAAALAVGIGAFALAGDGDSDGATSRFAVDETAAHITANRAVTGLPLSDPQILALLERAPNFGALTDPQPCLTGLDRPRDTPVLGAQPIRLAGRPAVLLVLPGTNPAEIVAIAVAPECDATHARVLAETVLPRP